MKCFPVPAETPIRQSVVAALAPKRHPPENGPTVGSFTPLKSILPSITLTKQKVRKLEAIQLIREQRENGKQELAFNARPFVLCGIPLRRPPQHQLEYTRRNGRFFLDITGHPRFGLPYGQDRLIPIWVATLAVRQKSPIVHFETAAEMLDFFRLPKDGPHYRRIVQGFQRIFSATIFFGTEDQPNGAAVIDWARFHFFDRIQLWFNSDEPTKPIQSARHDNVITLSAAFYSEIDQHRIPVEREVIAALAHAPGALDLYIWLVWKTWTVNGARASIPLFAASGLNEQLGTGKYSRGRFFRRRINRWLREVKQLWPNCPAALSDDGQYLIVRSSRKSPAIQPVQKPVSR